MSFGQHSTWSYTALRRLASASATFKLGRPTQEQGRWICQSCRHSSTIFSSNNRATSTPRAAMHTKATLAISHTGNKSRSVVNGFRSAGLKAAVVRFISTDTKEKDEAVPQATQPISDRSSSIGDTVQANISIAMQRMNDLTGFSEIETLKREVEECKREFQDAQSSLASARTSYSSAVTQRSGSQREVNELLQRKNSWSSTDLERFTSLYRSDHANETAETVAHTQLVEAEKKADDAWARFQAKISARFQEEETWNRKMRAINTWATWALIGLNILMLIGVEPLRRRWLVRNFEDKVQEVMEKTNASTVAALTELQADMAALSGGAAPSSSEKTTDTDIAATIAVGLDQVVDQATAEHALALEAAPEIMPEIVLEPGQAPSGWRSWVPGLSAHRTKAQAQVEQLFSERQVTVRQVDLTQKALEGLFAGVMVTSIIATLVRGW